MTTIPTIRRMLLAAMALLALGAQMIHYTFHPPFTTGGGLSFTNGAANLFPLVDLVLVTWLFSRKETAAWGYLLNGLIVIYGTVLMTHSGWARVHGPETPFWRYILISTSPEIAIAWVDFLLGAILYRLWFLPVPAPSAPAGERTGRP